MREIRLHDTRTGRLTALDAPGGRVGIYACGPTVYARIHIGNARPFVVFSLLRRFLEHEGLRPELVINVTDINDKIYVAARAAGRPSDELAREMAAFYVADTDLLGLGRPDHEPLASQTLDGIIGLIGSLVERGHAYEAGGDVLFSVRSDPDYGSLSHRSVDEMDQGEGVEGAERKRDPLDFALWKARKPDEDTWWASPWGPGRPGWHIECSAMAEELLGVNFAIHGGGSDLVFPHHENEAAQTRAGRGAELARIWMHNGMLQFAGEKMAKSTGNIAPLHVVVERWGRDAVILAFCAAHYRQPMQFGDGVMRQATAGVARLREVSRVVVPGESPEDFVPIRDAFFDALAQDFNTAGALAELWRWIKEANRHGDPVGRGHLEEMLQVLGLENLLGPELGAPDHVVDLARRRQQARESRDFTLADVLRDEIAQNGWTVRDGPGGFELTPA
ncbi:cysteine--tRNA ligase [Capillimicrobium parvum]|uniref:Cysteine--tRNA ligase n=1 Tax=Capillimicrobium parvum TaxID=2884022 RepID=A0A9E7C1W1_9ACTN|nr:cysteine--tRNA ligase [Capillimicrobium parvum]UGS37905.1 Cysteine--tRNA ligase [Capillimicrobium parvum]